MNFEPGMIVKSKAGHDKNNIYVVIRVENEYVYLADGQNRTLDRMKKKNVRHLQPILYDHAENRSDDEAIRNLCRRIKNVKN
nr:KOW domain-containing RNA-binding protein [uncultured Mediterraneibacter sp.]